MNRRNVGVKWGVDLEEIATRFLRPKQHGHHITPPFCEETCTVPRRLRLITCAVLTTALLVSSTSEATQPRTHHPNPMVTQPQAQQPKCNQECNHGPERTPKDDHPVQR